MHKTVGVFSIIPRGNTVLVLRRSHAESFLPGAFDLPGGGIELGESPSAAVKLEVMEETGISVSVVRILDELDCRSTQDLRRRSMVVFLLEPDDDPFQVRLSSEHDEYRWITKADLDRVFKPGDLMRQIIAEFFSS